MPSDSERLLRYARDRDETAFAELVRAHIDLVYSAALRRVRAAILMRPLKSRRRSFSRCPVMRSGWRDTRY